MAKPDCPFCAVAAERIFHAGRRILAMWDGFPVSPGHALIVPKRHIGSWFDATRDERGEIVEGIDIARDAIRQRHAPDGFNIGINEGPSAGQTIAHLHVHVIPRYQNDVEDPRGGIRHVIPHRADYWSHSPEIPGFPAVPGAEGALVRGEDDPLLPHLLTQLDRAERVDIAVAFILPSGMERLVPQMRDLIDRGGALRILTGDYLDVTDPDALQLLIDLQEQAADPSRVSLRIFEAGNRGFHPKAYLFHDAQGPFVAYVGSSNLTRSALTEAVEWNYRVVPARDRAGLLEVARGFETLWRHGNTRTLDQDWIDGYRRRRRPRVVPVEVPDEPAAAPPEPHPVQREALSALEATREEGNAAGLVVLATGLGKTWLSAFDSNRPEFRRVLFVAHREEILNQAMSTFRRIRPRARLGKYTGQEKLPDAEVVFASIQTLGRLPHLRLFDRQAFDYIIVDEFHHAAARTYRRLLDYFEPKFLLGLTATPERTDGGDLLALCQENLVYRKDLYEGIRLGLLSPFQYFGVPDDVDYQNIPWRGRRFDEEALTQAVATRRRAENAMEEYRKRAGRRTLAFCCSTAHADFMAGFFREQGVRAVAVHSAPGSAPRASSLEQLEAGERDVVFAVDMFNEGVDLPNIDTVMMLRPTESKILWLQQFGRGLRVSEGKSHLTVIDYIGNHRVFLIKAQTLLQLGSGDFAIAQALERLERGEQALPPECQVTYELEAVRILRGLLRLRGADDSLLLFYESFKDRHGERPTASECFHEGYNLRAARRSHGSWFRFVQAQGDLEETQEAALGQAGSFLESLETTPMTRSYKMLVLLAMLNRDSLPGRIRIEELTEEFGRIARRSVRLQKDVGDSLDDPGALRRLIEQNPVDAWVGGRGTRGRRFFRYSDDELKFAVDISEEVRQGFQELVRELADWRLAEYLERGEAGGEEAFVCKVSHAQGRPILFLPKREEHPDIPSGWTSILVDGKRYEANFVEVAVDVARPEGSTTNELPNILYGWFGRDAGRPGTNHHVLFDRRERGYVARPQPRAGTARPVALEVGRGYRRDQVPDALGLPSGGRSWQTGFVQAEDKIVLFVTLEKEGLGESYAYEDRFLSADRFEWQSQNRTTQRGTVGQRIRHHAEQGIEVHLFVRQRAKSEGKTLPFVYCGELEFVDWDGERPITVQWRLKTPLSETLRKSFSSG